jgi:hypothetical protein
VTSPRCTICARDPRSRRRDWRCPHDPIERERAVPKLEPGTPTAPQGKLFVVDLDSAESVAKFLEVLAKRERAR